MKPSILWSLERPGRPGSPWRWGLEAWLLSALLLSAAPLHAQRPNARCTFWMRGLCDRTLVGPPGSLLDDGTLGEPYMFLGEPGYTIEVMLTTEENPSRIDGVHTWGFGLGTEGPLSIVDINTRGTAGCSEGMRGTDGRTFPECKVLGIGVSLFGLTGPPNGAGPQTEENKGAWSFCIVKLDGAISLPPEGIEAVCKVRLAARFPDVEGETVPARVYFAMRVPARGVPPQVYVGGGGAILETEGNPPLVVEACEFLLKASSVSAFVRCDANDDGTVSIADAVWILNELFLGGARTRCAPAADCDGDGERSLSDAVYGLMHLFQGAPPPPPPYPGCDRVDVPVEECPPGSTRCP